MLFVYLLAAITALVAGGVVGLFLGAITAFVVGFAEPEPERFVRPFAIGGSGVGTVPGKADGLEAGPHSCGTGPDRVLMEGPGGQVRAMPAVPASGGITLACPPSALALLRWSGDVRQLGVVARPLSPTDSRVKVEPIGQAVSCKGRCGRLEPYQAKVSCTVLRGRRGSDASLLPDHMRT